MHASSPLRLGATLLKLFNHIVEIGIARAKAPGEPIATPLGDSFSISQDLKLAGLARCYYWINA
jgi:hypothetical protein